MNLKQITTIVFFSTLGLTGQELDLSFLKGLEAKAREATSISLGPEEIKLMMGFSGEGSKELQGLGKNIERVQVTTLEFDKEGMYNVSDMDNLRAKLKSPEFVPIISVKERNGFTEILMRKGPKGMNGFVVLSAEPRELTIVNIVGDLDLASLGRLTGKFGIPNLHMGSGKGEGKGEGKGDGKGGKKDDDEEK